MTTKDMLLHLSAEDGSLAAEQGAWRSLTKSRHFLPFDYNHRWAGRQGRG